MPVENVIMPKLGVYTEDVVLSTWCAPEGAEVAEGTVVLEMETDKTTAEVEAESSGWLHQLVTEGASVPIGAVVGKIATTREEYEALASSDAGGSSEEVQDGDEPAVMPTSPLSAAVGLSVSGRRAGPPVSPRARSALRRLGLPPEVVSQIEGSGPGGRILERDVIAATPAARPAAAPPVPATTPGEPEIAERIPLRGRRRTIAQRMVSSLQTAAQLTSVLEIDTKPIVDLRERLAAAAEPQRVGVTAIVVELIAGALREHPLLNARVAGDEIEVLADLNIGVAVDTPDGLLVPVVHRADTLSLTEIHARVADVAERGRAGTLTLEDVKGGTFTLSNGGIHNVDITTAILNPPQVAILWIGRIRQRPVVVGDGIAIRPTLQACLTFDHRAIDGGPAAAFLTTLERRIAGLADRA
ncbi:MAG: dihydrolipoamide acetyltransferase family protein [Gaiellales bacterium]